MTLTQSRWVTTWVDSCYNLSDLIWKQDTTGGAIAVGTTGNGMEIDAPRVNSSVSFALDVEPAVEQLLTFEIASLTAGTGSMIAVEESIGGQWKTLNSVPLDKIGLITLSFVPLGNGVKVSVTGPTKVILNRICRKKPIQYQESYLTQVCNGDKDRYRFGFNGQEKVNEIAGVGNHNTAEFWEYDTRTARRWNLDPVVKPWESSYAAFNNSPITVIDPDGRDGVITSGSGNSKEDPLVIKANYYYSSDDLNSDEIKGLSSAIEQFNNKDKKGENRVWEIKTPDGKKYVKFDLSLFDEKGDLEELANKDVIMFSADNNDRQSYKFGNVVKIGNITQPDNGIIRFAAGGKDGIDFDRSNTNAFLRNYDIAEGSLIKLYSSIFSHELGHNLGGNHGDPGSLMDHILPMAQKDGVTGVSTGKTVFTTISINSDAIRAMIGRIAESRYSIQSKYLSSKEQNRVNKEHEKTEGSSGKIHNPRK
jgi:hypothetical protein